MRAEALQGMRNEVLKMCPTKRPLHLVCHSEAYMQGVPNELRDAHPVSWTLSDPLGHSVGCAERDGQSTSCCD